MSSYKFGKDIEKLIPELVETRRELHMYPETGYNEIRTSKLVADRLESLGFEVKKNIGKTGVVGLLRGTEKDGKTIAFRADMDALELTEENDCEYKSKNIGQMHACGHDGHTAILLGFARWLSERKDQFDGNVKLLFQPAEEGGGGAEKMIADGALENPRPDRVFGLHLWNGLPLGTVAFKDGPVMASTDTFHITVHGKGGHGAIPQQTIDPLLIGAHIVTALQSIITRRLDPIDPAVISVTVFNAGETSNIIPEKAKLAGTVRCFSKEVREEIPKYIEEIAGSIAKGMGGSIDFRYDSSYGATVNDKEATEFAKAAALNVFDAENILEAEATMGAEDVSYFLNEVPGSFFFLGSSNADKGLDKPHHNPRFDFDEDVLPIGVALFAEITKKFFR